MTQKGIQTSKELATRLYDEGFIRPKDRTDSVNEPWRDRQNDIGAIEKKIQSHVQADTVDCVQGQYLEAYRRFFACSADYLFGETDITSCDFDVRHFCERSCLSEKAVNRLIEGLSPEIKKDAADFWSHIIESNAYYMMALEFHSMCYEIGQYYAAQNMIKNINTMGIDSADRFAEAWRAMMEENYKQKAEPHKGAYHMHLNEILANLQYYFERWADEYARSRHKEIDKYFFDQLSQELSDAKKLYIEE